MSATGFSTCPTLDQPNGGDRLAGNAFESLFGVHVITDRGSLRVPPKASGGFDEEDSAEPN